MLGEANFSDHGANRLGASALMQGLADGYFVLPYTIGDYLAIEQAGEGGRDRIRRFATPRPCVDADHPEAARDQGQADGGLVPSRAGQDHVGLLRHGAQRRQGSTQALGQIRELREEFWQNVNVPGTGEELNQALEKAGRVADFFELGELMCLDALQRNESCGGHFREEYQTPDGEAQRDDEHFSYVAAWEISRAGQPSGADTRSRLTSSTCIPSQTELQVDETHPARLAADGPQTTRAGWCSYPMTDVNADMSFLEMLDVLNEDADRARARSRSPSITIAAKASAARAAS